MSGRRKQRQIEQPTPSSKMLLSDTIKLSHQMLTFIKNDGLSVCDQCNKKVRFEELEKINSYSDFLVCQDCKKEGNF
jgi:hypothetical protein